MAEYYMAAYDYMKVPISVGKFENIFIFIKQSINIKIWLHPSPW